MSDIDITNMEFHRVLRSSDGENIEDSFAQQRMTTNFCAEKNGVIISGTSEFPAFSATTGRQVQPLLDLIDRVNSGELKIDGFILDAYSRWARSDVDEALLYAACREANLLILTDKEGLMMGPGTWAKRGASTDQNEGYARDVGRHLSRAVVKLILAGLIPPTMRFPWGMDREYYDPSGNPTFRVRKLADGRHAVLDPDPPHSVRFILPPSNRLHLREEGHSFKWVPGAPELQAIAQEIFRKYYIGNETAFSICGDLNRRRILTRTGKAWTVPSLSGLLRNPLWIGWSVGFTVAKGRHCERDKTGVTVFPVAKRAGYRNDKKKRRAMKEQLKPVKNWIIVKQPKLANFLDEDVRKVVDEQWKGLLENGRPPKRPLRLRNLPPKSRYFLTGILRIKDTPVTMFGSDGPTRGDDALRYYITRRAADIPVAGAPKERVRADLVEEKVLLAIETVIREFPIHISDVAKYIDEKRRELRGKSDDSGILIREKNELEEWYKTTYSVAGIRGRTLLAAEAERVEKRLHQIDLQLAEAKKELPEYLEQNTPQIIASVRRQIDKQLTVVRGNCFKSLRSLAAALCSNLTFDPANRVVDIEIALPAWAMSSHQQLIDYVGTAETPAHRSLVHTNCDGIVLLSISCKVHQEMLKPTCFVCSRPTRSAA